VTGFVLAGGASRRMGQAKASLVLGGEAMLARQLRLLAAVCRSVAVIGLPPEPSGLDAHAISDDLPGLGPLGGIYTGLRHCRTEYGLFLGCDLPFMEARFLRYLAGHGLASRADVTVPQDREGRVQPLCALFRRRIAGIVRRCLEEGQNKSSGFYPRVHAVVIPWRESARAGFAPRIFANMNTPQEYEEAKRTLT
jgi:molybdopterin-guanine dinucleotide biosynthesis protein A